MASFGSFLTRTCILMYIYIVHVNSECPLGWIHYDKKCFHFSHDKRDWFTAESSCHYHNGRLAEPVDKNETDYLLNMAFSYMGSTGGLYWLGGRDDIMEGTWQWSSSDNVISYLPWWQNQPDNANEIENCLEMACHGSKCLYNDRLCSFVENYICERSYPGVETEIIG